MRAGKTIKIKGAFMPGDSTVQMLQVNFPDLQKVVKINDVIFFSDGDLMAIVVDLEEDCIHVEFRS